MANEQGEGAATARTAAEIEAELAGLDGITGHWEEDEGDNGVAQAEAEAAEAAAVDEAGRQGWVPKHLYKGDATKWVDAATFIKRGERFNNNLQREVQELRKKLEGFEGTKKAFLKFHEETIAAKDAELAETIKSLRVQRSEATRNGEDELAISLEDRIDLLKDQQKELKAPVEDTTSAAPDANAPNPVLDEWVEDGNAWFRDDPQLRSYAIALGDGLIKDGETARGRKFLDLVSAKMAEDFPRKFRSKTTAAAGSGSAVEGSNGGGSTRTAGGKTERDLPAADLELMKQFIREGYTTKEKFLVSYFSNPKNR